MSVKSELIKIKEKIKTAFIPEYLQEMEKMSKSSDPLSYGALNNAIDRLIDSRKTFNESTETPGAKALQSHFSLKESSAELDNKVDEFISWYTNNMVKGHYTDIGEYHKPRDLRNFIEKMAVWYELRYPDYEVNRMMYCCSQEQKNINEEMFVNNPMTSEMINGIGTSWSEWSERVLKSMSWDEFYNAKAFINSLPSDEKYYLIKAKYSDYTRLFIDDYRDIIIYLTSNGFVKGIRETYLSPINGKDLDSNELVGMNIKDVIVILKENYNCTEKQLKDIIKEISEYENQKMFKEELLNCVMYRIIERGGTRIGSRRAFLFAQEFGRNIDIPMIYGVDYSDPGLREFMNLYLKAGGSKELVCFTNYGCRASKKEKLNTTTLQELIKNHWNNAATKYTPEEDELHQRLVNILTSQVNQDEVKKEEVKRLRLERKLENSRK